MTSNNMGSITRREMESFANKVVRRFPGFRWEWTKDVGLCIKSAKVALISEKYIGFYPWQAKEHILHEFAHINFV